MTTTPTREPAPRTRLVDKAQYGLAAFLVVVGAWVVIDASTLVKGYADQPVQPYTIPYIVGAALVVLGVLLAVATARGDRPEMEEGEDVEIDGSTDWRTVGLLVGVMALNVLLIDFLGWAITGALLFAGASYVLGSRTPVRDVAIGAALSVGSWYGLYSGLGIPIPAGILDGVL